MIAIKMLVAAILTDHFFVLVILGTPEMAQIVKILMNVLRVVTIATQTLHAQIRKVHFSVLVMLATEEMGHIVKI